MAVPQINGTLAGSHGSGGSFDQTTNQFPGYAAGVEVHILGFTVNDVSELVEQLGKDSRTVMTAVPERKWEVQIEFIVCADTIAKAKAVQLPLPMQLLTIQGRDSAEENGNWNYLPGSGSFTGGTGRFKLGSMTLRRFQGADFTVGNATSFSEIAS